MSLDQVLTCLAHSLPGSQRFSNIQEQIFIQAWEGSSYAKIAEVTGYDVDYVKNVGYRLWQSLSALVGERVTKSNFQSVLRRYCQSQAVNRTAQQWWQSGFQKQDWGDATKVSNFIGRLAEQKVLQAWLQHEGCQVVALVGMAGIGKTALATQVAEALQAEFDFVIWRSLGEVLSLDLLITDLLQVLPPLDKLDINPDKKSPSPDIIQWLKKYRCLIILDQWENLLYSGQPVGVHQKNHQNYSYFLKQISRTQHQSCFILTSRELPQEITLLSEESAKTRYLQLDSLEVNDAQKLIQQAHIPLKDLEEWRKVIHYYGGNPFFLKKLATTAKNLFEGDFNQFFTVFHQIPLYLGESIPLISQQMSRMSASEIDVIYWLSLSDKPLTTVQLCNLSVQNSRDDIHNVLESLNSLILRSLIRNTNEGFTLYPVIRDYIKQKFVDRMRKTQ